MAAAAPGERAAGEAKACDPELVDATRVIRDNIKKYLERADELQQKGDDKAAYKLLSDSLKEEVHGLKKIPDHPFNEIFEYATVLSATHAKEGKYKEAASHIQQTFENVLNCHDCDAGGSDMTQDEMGKAPPELDRVKWYLDERPKHKFTILIWYRGSWWPYCRAYVTDFSKFVGPIREAGGQIFAICAEPNEIVQQTKVDWGVDYDFISDPFNTLAKEYDVVVSHRRGYPHGMGQPGVMCETAEGKRLYKWKIIPSIMNSGGASDRPVIAEVWGIIKDKVDGKEVDPSREENIGLTSKKDWRTMHQGIINLFLHLFSLPFSKKS